MSETNVSKPALLGSGERFDLRAAPYSVRGSYLCIHEAPEDRNLYLSITRSPVIALERKNLIRLTPVLDGKALPFKYAVTPGKLAIETFKGAIEATFASGRQLRIRGEGGVGLRFSFKTIQFENASPKENGDMEIAYIILGKLLFAPLKGAMLCGAKWVPAKARAEDFDLELLPSVETGKFEAAIHEYYSNGMRDGEYASFDSCAASVEREFDEFCKNYPAVPEQYAQMARLAAWTVWTHSMRPEGRLKSPAVYMSRTFLTRAFGWQQSYQAMAASNNIREAWSLLLNMFDYQNEAGQIPDNVGEIGISYMVSKPAMQGFALEHLLSLANTGGRAAGGASGGASALQGVPSASPGEALGLPDYDELYCKLSKFAGWWLSKRDRNSSGIPQYYHADESGWDDATIFKKGLPLQSGDLLAWLALLTEACGTLAEKARRPAGESERWARESKRLLSILVDEFWNGRQFISRVAETGEIVESGSIAALQPIILGKRLPSHIIDTIASRLSDEREYLTEGGVVSEILGSPDFAAQAGFMRGNIVAPVQLLVVLGLKNAGKTELARAIAERYCDFACKNGLALMLPPYACDPATGLAIKTEDRYDPDDRDKPEDLFKSEKKEAETIHQWTSWAAASFLTVAGFLDRG
jgi:hypothetical protein